MPTVDREGPFRVIIYPNDHEPAHVHLLTGDGTIVVNLLGREGQPELRELYGNVGRRIVRQALELVAQRREQYLARWHDLHGEE